MTIQTFGFVPRVGSLGRPDTSSGIEGAKAAIAQADIVNGKLVDEIDALYAHGAAVVSSGPVLMRAVQTGEVRENAVLSLRAQLDDLFARGASEAEIAEFRASVAA